MESKSVLCVSAWHSFPFFTFYFTIYLSFSFWRNLWPRFKITNTIFSGVLLVVPTIQSFSSINTFFISKLSKFSFPSFRVLFIYIPMILKYMSNMYLIQAYRLQQSHRPMFSSSHCHLTVL